MNVAARIGHQEYKHPYTSHLTSLIGMFLDLCVAKSDNARMSCDDDDFHHDDAAAPGADDDDSRDNGVHDAWSTSLVHQWLRQGLQAPCKKNIGKYLTHAREKKTR